MILALLGQTAVSCVLVCAPTPQGVEYVEPVQAYEASTGQTPVARANAGRVSASGIWDRLAECESNGEWDYGPHSDWGSGIYHGGLQFHPDTWTAYAPSGYPEVAYRATREQQIVVAERVLDAEGWQAWPACSRKLGLR